MKISYRRRGSLLSIRLAGELDQHCAESLRGELDRLLDETQAGALELDMSGVRFMDSSGLGVILGRYKKLSAKGGRMGIKNASGNIERILRMAGIYTLVERIEGEMKI